MYDIRYIANSIGHTRRPANSRRDVTMPYISFQEFERDILPDKSMDISAEQGILAAGKSCCDPFP